MKKLGLAAKTVLAMLSLSLVEQPLLADVKTGVDAWTRGEYDKAVKE